MTTGSTATRTRVTERQGDRPHPYALVKAVCDVVAQPGGAIDAAEINRILIGIGVTTRPTGFAKADGLCMVLFMAQLKDASRFTDFISRALDRGVHVQNPERFTEFRRRLERVMRDYGLNVDGMGSATQI